MNKEEKFNLITKNTEEVLTPEDLRSFIKQDIPLKHYIGFEISGKIHLGTGLMCMQKVKDFMDAGADCSIFLADWHTWINDKLGGEMKTIQKIAVGYFKEGLKASFRCVGGNPEKLKFILGSKLYHHNDEYWATVIDVSKNITLARNLRSLSIMGREQRKGVDFAKLIYPPMQVADVFIQEVTIAHAGMDQRKAHVIVRDVALNLKVKPLLNPKGEKIKPVAIHHHLLLGLHKPPVWPVPKDNLHEIWTTAKMSKSAPNSCVFVHDSPDEIRHKITKAFCPTREVGFNPVLDWAKFLIFKDKSSELLVKRSEKFGGDIIFKSFEELSETFTSGSLHPEDLKKAVAEKIIEILEPARKHFEQAKTKKMLEEMDQLTPPSPPKTLLARGGSCS